MEKQFKKEVDEEVKKSRKRETIVAFVALVILTLLIGGGIYWYISSNQLSVDTKNYTIYKKKGGTENSSTSTTTTPGATTKTDATANWKVLTGTCGFSIKYPDTWIYKDFGSTEGTNVAFADKVANLPPEQSDASPIIGARCSSDDASNTMTNTPSKLVKETITIDGITAKKWTLLPGRPDDMAGDIKFVFVIIPLKNSKFLWVDNTNDQHADIYAKMLNTIDLK